MHSSSLVGDYQNYTLAQVATRLSALSLGLWQSQSCSLDLSEELQVAAMCCARAQSRLECALDFLGQYRSQRDILDGWLDREIDRWTATVASPCPLAWTPCGPTPRAVTPGTAGRPALSKPA